MSKILYNSWTGDLVTLSDYDNNFYEAKPEDFKFGQILYIKNTNKKCVVVGQDSGNNILIVVEGTKKIISKFIGYLTLDPKDE